MGRFLISHELTRISTKRITVDLLLKGEVYQIIGAVMDVHRELGFGFLEPVYQEALPVEFGKRNIPFLKEERLRIYYKDVILGKIYIADFVCFNQIIVEIKAVQQIPGICCPSSQLFKCHAIPSWINNQFWRSKSKV